MARDINLEQKIIKLYQSGLSMAKVGKEVNKSAATVLNVLRKYNIETRTKGGIYQLPTQDILNKYLKDMKTLESIGKDYNVSINTIKKIIVDNGGTIRTVSKSKNPYFKENFFEEISTEAKAYYLGLLITDGCILEPDVLNNHPNYKVQIELQEKDAYILEKLKQELQLTSTNIYHGTRIKTNYVISNTASLGWYSTKMAKDLSKYGVVPRKTPTAYLPILDDKMMPHLLRGMIDGDGCITITHSKNKPILVVYFCGNQQTVTQVRDFLVNTLNVFNVKVIQAGPNLWQISWASKKDTLKICNYLYEDANFYLTRKFEIYKNALSNFENTEVT